MYEDLIKQMRCVYQEIDCPDCPLEKGCMTLSVCAFTRAADTIEGLSTAYQMISEAYEAEVTKQNWLSVTERLPDNIDEEVLVCNEGYGKDGTGFATVAVYNGNGWLECWERKQYLDGITYWMPLPEPPKEES